MRSALRRIHSPRAITPPLPTPGAAAGRIPSLDGLRGIAIALVLLQHGWHSLPELLAPLAPFAGNGSLGVSIFFLLSGFLIFSLSVREQERTGEFDWRQFYLRRILRIFPCFYFYLLFVLTLAHLGLLTVTDRTIFAAETFSLNYHHVWDPWPVGLDYHVIGHYWTLALEEQFYLTWPLLMFLFVRGRLVPTLAGVIVLAPAIRVVSYFLTPDSRPQIGMMFHTGFDGIAAGVLLGELLRRERTKAKLQCLARNPWVLGAAIAFPAIVSPLLTEKFGGAYALTVGRTLDFACLALVLTAAVTVKDTVLFRVLNWRPLCALGVLSYSLYVWNNLFLNAESGWATNVFPFNFLCVAAMGLFSYFCIEKPFLSLKDRFHRRVATPALPEALPTRKSQSSSCSVAQ